MTNQSCFIAIRELAAGQIAEALPLASCTLVEAVQAFEALAKEGDATGALGEDRVQVRWRALHSGVAGTVLRLWHDGEQLIAVEIEDPRPTVGWEALRKSLGAPNAKLDYWEDVVKIQDGQWVYPTRGLAVFTRFDDAELVRVVAFPPTTIASYRMRLARGLEPPREFREP